MQTAHKMTDTTKTQKHSPKDVVERLRTEAKKSPVLNAVLHIFAVRQRARQQVTIGALRLTMTKKGFHYSRAEYEGVLRFLASLGLGSLDYDMQGRLRALKEVRVTLQSVGLAAVAKADSLERFSPDPVFARLPDTTSSAVEPVPLKKELSKAASGPSPEIYKATLTVVISGQAVNFDLPKGLSPAELGQFLSKFYLSSNAQ